MRKFNIWVIATTLSLGLAACVGARDDLTATTGKAATPPTNLTIDSPIRELLANPGAVGVLQKDMPGMISDPRLDMVKSMSLRQISQYPDAKLDSAKLKLIQADLDAATGRGASTAATSTAATPALPPMSAPNPATPPK